MHSWAPAAAPASYPAGPFLGRLSWVADVVAEGLQVVEDVLSALGAVVDVVGV
jgi:hypothetical protein